MRGFAKRFAPEPVRQIVRKRRMLNFRRNLLALAETCLSSSKSRDREILRESLTTFREHIGERLGLWRYPTASSDCVVDSKHTGRFFIRGGTDDLYHAIPGVEKAVEAAIRGRLKKGSTFVDGGANIGFYTILAGHTVGLEGRVISVEMTPGTASVLRKNVELNGLSGNVRVVEKALTDSADDWIVIETIKGKMGQNKIAQTTQHGNDGHISEGAALKARTARLDTILADIARVDLLKLDVEGAELMALEGASGVLDRIDCIVFEDHTGTGPVANYLSDRGFKVEELDPRNFLAQKTD